MEAYALALETPEDGWTNEIGDRIGLAFDLEWESVSEPTSISERAYSLEAVIHGDLQVDSDRWDVDGKGLWLHRWGPANESWFDPLMCSGHTSSSRSVHWMIDGPTGAQRAARHLLTNRWCDGNLAAERNQSI